MAYRFSISLVASLFILVFPLAALAQSDDDADDESYREMIDLSNAAADAVADGNFEIGAVKFRQAYDSYPDPILLNNEMIAWYRAGDCQKALPPAQLFLETGDPEEDDIDSQDRNDVETVLIECHLELADDALDDDNAVLATYHLDTLSPLERTDDEQKSYETLRAALAEVDDEHVEDQSVAPAPAAAASSQHFGWMQIAGGIALAGVGLSLHTVALTRQSQLESLADAGESDLLADRQEQWGGFQRTTRWAVPTLYALGATAVGSGIYFLMRPSAADESVALTPQISTEQAGLSLTGRF